MSSRKCIDLALTTTSPLRVCAAERSELALGCPAWHSASPWDASSGILVHVYSTMAPMQVMGASFATTPTSNGAGQGPAHGAQAAGHSVQRDGCPGHYRSAAVQAGTYLLMCSQVARQKRRKLDSA
jgi:hypothetical protein